MTKKQIKALHVKYCTCNGKDYLKHNIVIMKKKKTKVGSWKPKVNQLSKKKIVVVEQPKKVRPLTKKGKETIRPDMLGNRWFEIRSVHGREKIFANAELMWAEALKYFEWCDANPEKRAELVKYEGSAVEEEVSVKRLYTLYGLTRFLNVNTVYFAQFRGALRSKPQPLSPQDQDFSKVITMIYDTIEDQQVSGAASGFFNGNIISRLVGLVDKKDVTSGDAPIAAPLIKVYNTAPPLAGSEDEIKD